MENHKKHLLHVLIGTFTLILLQIWLASNYQLMEDRIFAALFIQAAIFIVMVIALHSSKLSDEFKKITIGNKNKTTSINKTPTLKDIFLILIAVILGGLFAFIYTTSQLDTDYLFRAAGVVAVTAVWFEHIRFSYNVSKKP